MLHCARRKKEAGGGGVELFIWINTCPSLLTIAETDKSLFELFDTGGSLRNRMFRTIDVTARRRVHSSTQNGK